MVEVAKPDYLSLVNKGGSGFNVSELVTSIVAAEIEPKKSIHNAKQTKNENAISGIGFLNASSSVGKTDLLLGRVISSFLLLHLTRHPLLS